VKSRASLRTVLMHYALPILAAWLLAGTAMAAGPKHTILYSFKGLSDGGSPMSGLIFDSAGALYGTGESGGDYDSCNEGGACGVAFKLTPRHKTVGPGLRVSRTTSNSRIPIRRTAILYLIKPEISMVQLRAEVPPSIS
jgi:hypothetical protein